MKKIFLVSTILFQLKFAFGQESNCGFDISKKQKIKFSADVTRFKNSFILTNETIEIPVVFHIIYNGDYNNIDSKRILAELEDLNQNFLLLNDISNVPSEFRHLVGNSKIKFTLATIDPNGNQTNGIIRKKANRRTYNFKHHIFYADPIWNPKKYLNIYIGEIRNGRGNRTNYVNSYSWKNSLTDAIGLSYNWVGNSTRVLTHETGHWLGLWHIIEGGCSGENDGIKDTPRQITFTHGCPEKKFECNNACMFMNYMDYSNCRTMFTIGQIEQMRLIISKYRPGLIK